MKKNLFIILLVILSLPIFAAPKVATFLVQLYENGNLRNTNQALYTYDGNGFNTLVTGRVWDTVSSTWGNAGLLTYSYNSDGTVSSWLSQGWNGSSYVNSTQDAMTYSSGKMATQILQGWQSSAWANSSKQTYAYDGNGYLTTETSVGWVTATSSWQTQAGQTLYTNNSDGTVANELHQTWNGSSWDNYSQVTYTYANGKVASQLSQSWVSGAWQNVSQQSYAYDANNYLITETYQSWITASSTWYTSQVQNYTNNSDGSVNYNIVQVWNSATSTLYNYEKLSYTYTATGIEKAPEAIAAIYPNPAQDVINVSPKNAAMPYDITMTDMTGQTLFTQAHNTDAQNVNISHLPAGIYLLKVTQGDGYATQKVVKQ